MNNGTTPWINRRPGPQRRLRLYCFPYAGGNATLFDAWQARLDPLIEVCAVQLPGRGARFKEPLCTELPTLVAALAEAILGQHDQRPFAFFGHSLGALVAFELTRFLRGRSLPLPAHLFVSGCAAPQHRSAPKNLHLLPDDELIAALRENQGTPPEVLAHHELMQLVLPIVRADFQLAETYRYRPTLKLNVPMTVFAGRDDNRSSAEQVTGWQKETTPQIGIQWFDGGHFFIHHERDPILDCLKAELAGAVVREGCA